MYFRGLLRSKKPWNAMRMSAQLPAADENSVPAQDSAGATATGALSVWAASTAAASVGAADSERRAAAP
jgi:hypothetical protein